MASMDYDITKMTPHRREASEHMTSVGKKLFQYVEFDEDEQLVAEVRKHPIGVVFSVVSGTFVTIVIVVMSIVLAINSSKLNLADYDTNAAQGVILLIGLLLTVLCLAATFITTFVYRSSVLFITTDKIAEVSYKSLFNRKITQLGIGNVEDVSYEQIGIFSRIFHYGTLMVQTAGAKDNSIFSFVPDPNKNTQLIIKMHENYVEKFGN